VTEQRQPRVLIAKPGLDGHDRGAKVVARALEDAGFDVTYTGIRQTPEMIAETASRKDVDAIGLSILSGSHLELFPLVMQALKEKELEDVAVFAGGILPKEDYPKLEEMGLRGIFGPGSSLKDIVEFVRQVTDERAAAS
jgi:methylmalonyl-CoA mutase C-terminal domain/subunit